MRPDTDKRMSIIGKVFLFLICVYLLLLTAANFLLAAPHFEITAGIVTLLALVICIALAESFNELSIGRVLVLKRKVAEKTAENEVLESSNKELRSELVTLVSNISNSQVNNTFTTPPAEWLKLLGVVKTDAEDDEEKEERVNNNTRPDTQEREQRQIQYRLRRKATVVGLRKYSKSLPVSDFTLIERVEFTDAFYEIDPIMDRRIVFDGYAKSATKEIFIEVLSRRAISTSLSDRIYVMLSKIKLYREAKKINAELVLLLVDSPYDRHRDNMGTYEARFIELFQPAIKNGLLKIQHIEVTEEEVENEPESNQASLL